MTLKALLKKSRLTYVLASALRAVPYPIYAGWMRLCHALRGVEGNTVYFSSFNGALYDDNPKAVAEALHAVCPRAKLVFRLNRRGMAQSAVREQIEKGRGTQFDPKFADIMLAMIDEDTDYKMRE